MHEPAALPTFRLEAGTALAQAATANQASVTLASPALSVMTDLTQMRAANAHPATSLRQAEQIMIYQGVRMLFVVSEMPAIEGLVTIADMHGDRQIRVAQERGLRYDQLSLADVMTPLARLDAIDHARMASATVGDVVATLKQQGHSHLLVVEGAGALARVRGVISAAQIERQLGTALNLTPIASSFSEIEQALL